MAELAEVLEQVLVLAEGFGIPMPPAQQTIYAECLGDLPLDRLRLAVLHLLKTRTFAGNLPSIAEIREAAGGNGHSREGLEEEAVLAWPKLEWAVDYLGWDQSVAFDDPLIHHVIKTWAGGWPRLRDLDWSLEQIKWRRKEFLELYRTLARRSERLPKPVEYFPGRFEAENERRGFRENVPAPFLITGEVGHYRAVAGPGARLLPVPGKSSLKLLAGGTGTHID